MGGLRIALVSDFFHPALGGAEVHMYCVSSVLVSMGHDVIIVTHAVGEEYRGVKLLSSGVTVYYLSQLPFYNNASFPTAFSTLPMLRDIFLKDRIQIVHAHAAFSVLAHEALLHASVMGIATCFTDHSLFGFFDASAILTNKLLQASLASVNRVICVSYASKENTVLRSHIDPDRVVVVSNAIDSSYFRPSNEPRDPNFVTIVFCGRLELRKGADLLVQLIPLVCRIIPNSRFVIAGDGKKRPLLEEMRELHDLRDRVELLGNVAHQDVRGVLTRGDIFLNCSLTEAFCMAILEAASVGLFVVSTNVGGIPEVQKTRKKIFFFLFFSSCRCFRRTWSVWQSQQLKTCFEASWKLFRNYRAWKRKKKCI
jgi:phosphatidylinositol glycan class A protein